MISLFRNNAPAVAAAVSAAAFAILSFVRFGTPFVARLDAWMYASIASLHADPLTHFLVVFTELFDTSFTIILVAGLTIILVLERKVRLAAIIAGSLLLGYVAFEGLKLVFGEARPLGGLIDETGYGYPSGHATMAAAAFLSAAYAFRGPLRGKRLLAALYLLSAVMIVAIGGSRLYLGVHLLSDVLGGFLVGSCCFFGMLVIDEWLCGARPGKQPRL